MNDTTRIRITRRIVSSAAIAWGVATAGETDEFSLRSTDEPIPIRDVPATILNLLGLDDDQLRYLHAGRLRQLTDI